MPLRATLPPPGVRWAALAVAAALLAPVGAAAGSADEVKTPCVDDGKCRGVIDAILTGFGTIISSVLNGISSIVTAILAGFAELVVKPFLAIFGGFFTGLGQGLGNAGRGAFNGVADTFAQAWYQSTSFFQRVWILGPLAPLVSAAILIATILGFLWLVGVLFRHADDLLPERIEKMFRDEDDE